MLDALRRAVLSLPLRYREAVVLCDLQETPYAEAADALGCAVGTVRSRLHRGRALLAAKMQVERQRQPKAISRVGTTRWIA
jgi:RNA polymerase sigma-70 factor (ECF subfamily)